MNKKILLIDDDESLLSLVAKSLELKGYHVVTAIDGKEGLEKAEAENPDLVICDIKMPNMEGYTFVRSLKKVDSLKNTPIIIHTSYDEMIDLFKAEGISEYIQKSGENETLLRAVEKHLAE